MTRDPDLTERLDALRRGGDSTTAPLWIEALPADEALAELRRREGSVFRIQEARVLLDMGRDGDARSVLEGQADLPLGLAAVRDLLRQRLSGTDRQSLRPASAGERSAGEPRVEAGDGLTSVTLAELYATQGEVGAALAVYERLLAAAPNNESLRRKVRELRGERAAGAETALSEWLERVRGWRRALRV